MGSRVPGNRVSRNLGLYRCKKTSCVPKIVLQKASPNARAWVGITPGPRVGAVPLAELVLPWISSSLGSPPPWISSPSHPSWGSLGSPPPSHPLNPPRLKKETYFLARGRRALARPAQDRTGGKEVSIFPCKQFPTIF